MSTAAQDEYNNLIHSSSKISHRDADTSSEDDDDNTPISSVSDKAQKSSLRGSTLRSTIKISGDDDDDDDDDVGSPTKRSSTYYLPGSYDPYANTGPKGVIADAQAFELEKRGRQRTFERTTELKLPRKQINGGVGIGADAARKEGHEEDSYDDEELDENGDNEFVRKWREKRLGELKGGIVPRGRKTPATDAQLVERDYGAMETVDGPGFLSALENAPRGTVVVVYVFDEEDRLSTGYSVHLASLAQKHPEITFIALSQLDAELEPAGVPALLAYRNGDKFADMVPLKDEVPFTCNVVTNLEAALRWHGIISS